MSKIRITKEFNFETAHALLGYNGPCKNVHGHSYNLMVTVIGIPDSDDNSPTYGMVMDFGLLKLIIKECIVDDFDHALVLNRKTSTKRFSEYKDLFSKMILTPYQPTCENLLIDFANRIQKRLPSGIKLFSLKLTETVTSHAEWHADDNPQ